MVLVALVVALADNIGAAVKDGRDLLAVGVVEEAVRAELLWTDRHREERRERRQGVLERPHGGRVEEEAEEEEERQRGGAHGPRNGARGGLVQTEINWTNKAVAHAPAKPLELTWRSEYHRT